MLLRTAEGVPIDVALGALPFEERSVQRASDWAIGGSATLSELHLELLQYADQPVDPSELPGEEHVPPGRRRRASGVAVHRPAGAGPDRDDGGVPHRRGRSFDSVLVDGELVWMPRTGT